MKFWAVKVESGESIDVKVGIRQRAHLKQAIFENIEDCPDEFVALLITQRHFRTRVIGALLRDQFPQTIFKPEFVFEEDFSISHTGSHSSVIFQGYTMENIPDYVDTDNDPYQTFDGTEVWEIYVEDDKKIVQDDGGTIVEDESSDTTKDFDGTEVWLAYVEDVENIVEHEDNDDSSYDEQVNREEERLRKKKAVEAGKKEEKDAGKQKVKIEEPAKDTVDDKQDRSIGFRFPGRIS